MGFNAVALALTCQFLGGLVQAQELEEIKTQEQIVREQMLRISKELGVTCSTCHNLKNYKDASLKPFQVSVDHMHAVDLLRKQGFDGIKYPQANCYICHQGKLIP